MTTADKIKKVHELAARSAGTLSLGITQNTLKRGAMINVQADLRHAADLLEAVLNG